MNHLLEIQFIDCAANQCGDTLKFNWRRWAREEGDELKATQKGSNV